MEEETDLAAPQVKSQMANVKSQKRDPLCRVPSWWMFRGESGSLQRRFQGAEVGIRRNADVLPGNGADLVAPAYNRL
jgi:hypothetical protein